MLHFSNCPAMLMPKITLLIALFAAVLLCGPTAAVNGQVQDASQPESVRPVPSAAVAALEPLFSQLVHASSTRATVELSADTIVDGAVINSQTSVYQIASQAPNQFTVYLKDEKQRTRIYCDGETATIALSESAYTILEKPISMQQAVFDLPVPMGPYPEPVLALTLAGIDPVLSLAT